MFRITRRDYSFFFYCFFIPFRNKGLAASLLDPKDQDRVEIILKFIEDGDLRRWSLADIRAFNIGLSEWRSRLNCITNPYVYEQVWIFKV